MEISTIDLHNPQKVLLIGNGILRSFEKNSWGQLIESISEDYCTEDSIEIIRRLPGPLQLVAATKNQAKEKLKEMQNEFIRVDIQDDEQRLIDEIGNIGVGTILTTNYTYELECGFYKDFYCKAGKTSKFRELVYDCRNESTKRSKKAIRENARLYQCMRVPFKDSSIDTWHIHGEAAKLDTIVLGHYNYGRLLSSMSSYIGNFKGRYEYCKDKDIEFEVHSWIDYFMLCDVYTIGFGMAHSEFDIWWLINSRCRNGNNETNIHFYEPNISPELNMLANAYGVDVHTEEVHSGEYVDYYFRVVDEIKAQGVCSSG